jgi:hypothetical protein
VFEVKIGGTPLSVERSSKIVQLRQYVIAATIEYQERHRQCTDNKNLLCAQANKVWFRISASDALELASGLDVQSHDGEREP